MADEAFLDTHYSLILKAFTRGRVIPFLGAGVNLCDRPEGTEWSHAPSQPEYLPSGGELAGHLAEEFFYPPKYPRDLLRVSQYVAAMQGAAPLYETLHEVFDADFPPTRLHMFLASLPSVLSEKGYHRPPYASCHQLIVTTNYDDLMERAFQAVGEPFDVVAYVADGEFRGKFVHWPSEGEPLPIEDPNEYHGLSLDERSVVLKIHGAVDRRHAGWDSYVITEDHYIDFLTYTDISDVPAVLAAKLQQSQFLFLGYSLRDWNLRVMLHRIRTQREREIKSWAIQHGQDLLEDEFWRQRSVRILHIPLQEYIPTLRQRLHALPGRGGA